MRRSILLSFLGAALLAGCAVFPHRGYQNGRAAEGVGRKLVAEKREKSMLVAYDRTVCMVDPKRYEETRVRDAVWCNWHHEGSRATTPAVAEGGPPAVKTPVEAAAEHPTRPPAKPRGSAERRPAKKRD